MNIRLLCFLLCLLQKLIPKGIFSMSYQRPNKARDTCTSLFCLPNLCLKEGRLVSEKRLDGRFPLLSFKDSYSVSLHYPDGKGT